MHLKGMPKYRQHEFVWGFFYYFVWTLPLPKLTWQNNKLWSCEVIMRLFREPGERGSRVAHTRRITLGWISDMRQEHVRGHWHWGLFYDTVQEDDQGFSREFIGGDFSLASGYILEIETEVCAKEEGGNGTWGSRTQLFHPMKVTTDRW